MRIPCRPLLALSGTLPLLVLAAPAREYRVTVAPSSADREVLVATFALPADAPAPAVVQGPGGLALPVERRGGEGLLVVPALKAGATFTGTLRAARAGETPAGVAAQADRGRVRVTAGGRPVFDFQMDREALPRADIKPEFKRAGYIHPVYSPAGKVVTDDYPSNHVHHHGIWTPWTKTTFQGRSPDFWNMGAKTGAEDFVALDRTWSGAVQGGFEARLQMEDRSAPAPVVALHESWQVTAYQVTASAGRPLQVFDLVVTQRCATPDPLFLPKYHYGGFGFRGAAEWNGPGEAALFLTSEGENNRIKGNDTRGRWCYLGGRLGEAVAGTAILGHPANFRAPQPMRLHPNMPYMSFVPQALGDFAIEPGRPYVARFRFVAFDGPADRAHIDALWNGYAEPASVTVAPLP